MGQAFIFAGQAAQFVGMGRHLAKDDEVRQILADADAQLGFPLSEVMFSGPEELLTQTRYTQPAVFLHSVLLLRKHQNHGMDISAVAGHSLGELSALVSTGSLSMQDGLMLVHKRAEAMQEACDKNPGTMAAILGLADELVEEACASVNDIVVPANYNCPGQLVISGTLDGVRKAMEICLEKGARRAIEIAVGGAFHSPLMAPAREIFTDAVRSVEIRDSQIPVFQNVDALPHQAATEITDNLIEQITSPVRWTQSVQEMISGGVSEFIEIGGKGRILSGMVRKISRDVTTKVWTEDDE